MKEVKFKIWNAHKKVMMHEDGIDLLGETVLCGEVMRMPDDSCERLDHLNDLIPLLFSGMKHNGIEVCEGDVFNSKRDKSHPDGGYISGTYAYHPENAKVVVFEDGMFQVGYESLYEFLAFIRLPGHHQELIGNIYQNPDLIK